jgi:hypothetical protein
MVASEMPAHAHVSVVSNLLPRPAPINSLHAREKTQAAEAVRAVSLRGVFTAVSVVRIRVDLSKYLSQPLEKPARLAAFAHLENLSQSQRTQVSPISHLRLKTVALALPAEPSFVVRPVVSERMTAHAPPSVPVAGTTLPPAERPARANRGVAQVSLLFGRLALPQSPIPHLVGVDAAKTRENVDTKLVLRPSAQAVIEGVFSDVTSKSGRKFVFHGTSFISSA